MTSIGAGKPAMSEQRTLAAFLAFVVVGGGASVAIRTTYSELAPFWAATARFGLAAIGFWGIVAYRRMPLPKGRALAGAVVYGTLTVGLAFVLIAWGLVETPASLFQILMALVPLITLALSTLQGVEAISRRGLLGSLLAVAGIAVAVGGTATEAVSMPRLAAIVGAAALVAEGGVLIKRFPPNPPVMTNAIGLTAGAVILAIASLLRGEEWTIPRRADTWVAFVYLVVFVTLVAFLLYMSVLGAWSASRTSYGFVLVPLVTIVVAAVVAGETITANFLAGASLVLAGVLIGALLPSRARPAAIEDCRDRSGLALPRCV